MSKSKDETVDGPAIAAEILSRMNPERRSRIVSSIQTKAPNLASKIEEKMYNFDRVREASPLALQQLLKEVPPEDVTLSLKLATPEVKEQLLSNMSAKRREYVEEDLKRLPPTRLSEIEAAQRRILEKLRQVKQQTKEEERPPPKKEIWV